jgi:hypothetical protein
MPRHAVLQSNTVNITGLDYYYFSTPANWSNALALCEARGLSLTTVGTQELSDALHTSIKPLMNGTFGYWIGGNDIQVEGRAVPISQVYAIMCIA